MIILRLMHMILHMKTKNLLHLQENQNIIIEWSSYVIANKLTILLIFTFTFFVFMFWWVKVVPSPS